MGYEAKKLSDVVESRNYEIKKTGDVKDKAGNVIGQGIVEIDHITKEQLVQRKARLQSQIDDIDAKIAAIDVL